MTSTNLKLPFRLIRAANLAIILSIVLFYAVLFLGPEALGQLLNPHSSEGSVGLSVLVLVIFCAFVVIIALLPNAIVSLYKDVEVRSTSALTIVVIGSIMALLISALIVSRWVAR
jgi:hypothetical protein